MTSSFLESFNLTLVALSVLIAMLASYTAIDVAARITVAKGRTQAIWLLCGAVAMGMGIWSMHFVGMLACRMPFVVTYDFRIVAVSMLPAIAASGLALFLVSRATLSWLRLTTGSLLMGMGIATMHYVGMSAMRMPVTMSYRWPWVAISVLIAITVSYVGLFLAFRLRVDTATALLQLRKRLLAAVAMGAAIPTMHYTGMAAAQFMPAEGTAGQTSYEALSELAFSETLLPPLNDVSLAIAVIISTLIIFAIAWTSTFLDRLKNSEAKYKALAEKQEILNQQLRESEAYQRQQNQELQQTLDTLKSVQAQLIQTEKMSGLGQLVAGVAHEINNPINFIHGNVKYVESYTQDLLELLAQYQHCYPQPALAVQEKIEDIDLDFLKKDLNKVLSSMSLGTGRIREIVLSLRNFSRMDEVDCKSVDIHEGIESTLLILRHRLKSTSEGSAVQVVRDYDPLPNVDCYPGQLNQVFMNILANALDAIEEAKPTSDQPASITVRTSMLGDSWVEIAIADNGPGIPDAVRARIFDPFFTTKPIGKGTGLGLSICYKIVVERHAGKLECFASPGQGTEFLIQIPIRQKNTSTQGTETKALNDTKAIGTGEAEPGEPEPKKVKPDELDLGELEPDEQ